jgi:hypothetical protein
MAKRIGGDRIQVDASIVCHRDIGDNAPIKLDGFLHP